QDDTRPVVILMAELGPSGAIFEVLVAIEDPWNLPMARSELNFAIWSKLQDAGITIPHTKLDVRLDDAHTEDRGEPKRP
ncbi:MAG: hypothetical protein AAFX99_18620, partial [Myxococcota bacterium]